MASQNVVEITDDNFEAEVINSDVPVLVDFWAPWCGPCRMLTPIIDRLADQFAGKAKVGKLNVDENSALATRYGISSIPRILVFKGGEQPVDSVVGVVPEAKLATMLNNALNG
ncbi:thioredoxin [Tuwongella immobilis]|uniref:Thioredoxin n=1 Tax=Tuwongella immobilis TaxID=692036 RepID=A0A6C2YGM2_9BACT|nr:thioredoxin [Tuwongella immobilis]VIP00648.1 thioredoxin : Thioredoxin OS=Hydrogenobaculum sp. HO GN=HydHO_0610 PE=3 SV=1: Thioredoxin [Tuwongella immobilis]VTR96714.1 thioredoxin : Thioredoxin OS=Hydrogenobaculum sp. HO GN=HydHO_0610 PE=3 SV=1: Thioredoxin [Tuwongella immobilis]